MPFDSKHRLAARDPLGDTREPLRITERLHIKHDRGRPVILLPQLEQVISRDISAIPERREARDSS
jgi:hypothetical protein